MYFFTRVRLDEETGKWLVELKIVPEGPYHPIFVRDTKEEAECCDREWWAGTRRPDAAALAT